MSGLLNAPAALPPGKTPGIHWIGGWVGPRAGLDDMERRKPLPVAKPTALSRVQTNMNYDWLILPFFIDAISTTKVT
jgi:hypothetical protein